MAAVEQPLWAGRNYDVKNPQQILQGSPADVEDQQGRGFEPQVFDELSEWNALCVAEQVAGVKNGLDLRKAREIWAPVSACEVAQLSVAVIYVCTAGGVRAHGRV